MRPTFIFSFDCEGKWGIADRPNDDIKKAFTNENLNRAYKKILDLLNRYEIKATFAFVGAFTMSVEEYLQKQELFEGGAHYVSWLMNFRNDMIKKNYDGWFNPKCYEMVAKNNKHEIAAHGFSHIPLSENFITKDVFFQEMHSLKQCAAFTGRNKMTFIYPRHLVGYTNYLKEFGFIGFRAGVRDLSGSSKVIKNFAKLKSFLSEMNLATKAEPHASSGSLVQIPMGRFLNWRHGLRKLIPIKISIKRYQYLIENAIANNKVIHLYSHPNNFITGDRMFILLDEVLKNIKNGMIRQELVNLTQREYVEALEQDSNI